MPRRRPLRHTVACVTALCLAFASFAPAQDKKPAATDKPAAGKPAPDAAPAGAPSAAEMEAFMKMNEPGEHHAHLKQLAGNFDVDMEMTMAPGAPAQKSKGTEKSELNLGGRYLRGEYTGDMMGMKFQGHSLIGYDLQKKKYFNAWVDSMSTALLVLEGACDKAGKVFTFIGVYDDPMTGRKTKIRHVTTVVSPDKYTFEMFDTAEDGKEHRTIFATYTSTK